MILSRYSPRVRESVLPERWDLKMARQREENLDEIKDWLIRLEKWIEANKSLRHQDSNIELENFFRDLLNLTFGWELRNANVLSNTNQDSFDLSDEKNSIAVQVTVTTKAEKIRKTLKTFIGTHEKQYSRLIFVYPFLQLTRSQADFRDILNGYDFDANRDRMCFGTILKKSQDMGIDDQSRIVKLLRTELRQLGAAIQMGVDQTVETLIAVIQYMSENAPVEAVDFDELKPDQKQKLERFSEHSGYLLLQYRMNQELHVTVEQARDAIGYDTVRVAKIQAWLKITSLELLDTNEGNATAAFQAMAASLLQRAHVQGSDAEETAVRFLLADEFIRCNVFPNPAR
jgi:hypothetical protein